MKAVLLVIGLALALSGGVEGQTDAELEAKIDDLFIKASNPEAHHQHLVEPSREELAEMGELAVPRLVSKLSTEDARERHALADIFERLGSVAVPALIEALDTDNEDILKNASRALGDIGDKSATSALLPLFQHESHNIRSNAVTAVGKCHDSSAVDECVSLLADSVESVRKSAAVALGRIADARGAGALMDALEDPHYSVRMSAVRSLTTIGEPACESLVVRYDRFSDLAKYLAFDVWAGCKYSQAKEVLEEATRSCDTYARGFAIYALASVNAKAARRRIKKMLQEETDLFVLSRIDAAQELLDSTED